MQKFIELIAKTNAWCNKNRLEAGTLTAAWIGLPPESAQASTLVYLPKFTPQWMKGANEYLTILDQMGKFTEKMKGIKNQRCKPAFYLTCSLLTE